MFWPQQNRYRGPVVLGRGKIGRRQRAEREAEEAEPDRELDSYLAALTPEEDVESTGTGRRFGNSEVYQLRLPLMANERLKELAAKQGTSPAALARDWVLQHLAEHDSQNQSPQWPEQDMSAPTVSNIPPVRDDVPDLEQTEEITVPHERFPR